MLRVANSYSDILCIAIDAVLANQGWSQKRQKRQESMVFFTILVLCPPFPHKTGGNFTTFLQKQIELHKGAKLSGKIAAVPKVLRNGKELSKSPMVILPRSKEALENILTINVPLFKKLRDIIFFDPLNCPSLRSGQFKGSKKSWPPQNVPRNGS
jgi:hypothetical protein